MDKRSGLPSKDIEVALNKGISYLASVQHADGGFDSFSSPSRVRFKKAYAYRTTFVPSLILAALSGLEASAGRSMRQKLFKFVRAQRSPSWSFNYWALRSWERKQLPYPDDLDDTCCALIGLALHNKVSIGPATLAAMVKLLVATETQPGGPYRTWLVPPDGPAQWQDIDLAVNANVAYLLSLVSEPLPNITSFLEKAIRNRRLVSPYYASEYPLLYYVSRGYQGSRSEDLRTIAKRLRNQNKALGPLENATLLTSLLRLNDPDVELLASRLLDTQRQDGSWTAGAFCLDPARSGKKYYHGSESLTTALALEALNLYRERAGRSAIERQPQDYVPAFGTQAGQVLGAVGEKSSHLGPELRGALRNYMQRTVHSPNGTEIISLAQRFNCSLTHPLGHNHPALMRLGLANAYGWAAYTIFDDFMDEEGRTRLLPVAVAALRYSLSTFEGVLPEDASFHTYIHQVFDAIDAANAWELAHCRFLVSDRAITIKKLPGYSDASRLAERSLGHALGPLSLLHLNGAGFDGNLMRSVRQAFIHYLAARQLNDDLHDWQTDLAKGHITLVVARILEDLQLKPGLHDLEAIMPVAGRQFWNHSIIALCRTVQEQTVLSRQNLGNLPQLKRPNFITELLDRIDTSLQETLTSQDQARRFLRHYSRKVPKGTR